MPKPVRWVERFTTILKKDQIHDSLIKKEGFESYVGNQLWSLNHDEASLRYHDGCYRNWVAYETIVNDW